MAGIYEDVVIAAYLSGIQEDWCDSCIPLECSAMAGQCCPCASSPAWMQACFLRPSAQAAVIASVATLDSVHMCCRLRSWFKPHNPGLTAAEALTSPFFTYHYDTDFTPNI